MKRKLISLVLCALLVAPPEAHGQSVNSLRLGITPSTHEYRMGRTASGPPIPREIPDYRVAGAVFFGILGLGAVVIDRQAREEAGGGDNSNTVTDIFMVATLAGIGALLGSLIKKDP